VSGLLAFTDGRVSQLADASVPLNDEGLLRGDGCFEVVRVYEGRPFALDEHLDRMARSAAALRLPLAGVREAFDALCPGFEGFVRVLVTRGPPPRVYGLQEVPRPVPPTLRLKTVAAPWVAPLGSAPLAGAKTLSYAHNMAARRSAEEDGYDDALLVTTDSLVLEGPTWTLMWVEAGEVLTPPLSLGILDSITRRVMTELCEVAECAAPLGRVLEADEIVVVSTAKEAVGVSAIDGQSWDGAPGPVSAGLGRAFRDFVRRRARAATGPAPWVRHRAPVGGRS